MKDFNKHFSDIYEIKSNVFKDDRGFFYESFNNNEFIKCTGVKVNFVQDNFSLSNFGVLRGLHYQIKPFDQGKLVSVLQGSIIDFALDIRVSSPNFGKFYFTKLEPYKSKLWIPSGYAHGFLALDNDTKVLYKTTNYYSSEHERTIDILDSYTGIDKIIYENIKLNQLIRSDKDVSGKNFRMSDYFD